MKDFKWLYEHALQYKGEALESLLPTCMSPSLLAQVNDKIVFSTLTRRVFRAGLKHSLVDSKWPAFEKAFFGFDPYKVALMSDDQLENLMQNDQIIRHWGKIKATRVNAMMLTETTEKHGSCARWIAEWPEDNIIGLWAALKQQGAQMGGNSGACFLRMLGKDTFVLTDDVVAALKAQGIVDKKPTGKKDLQKVQDAFNLWCSESGRPLCHISRLLSFTVGW
ncbi:DNA-3-methyladenine glycosylase I [Neptunomonas antarctica]|uniref:DNA-3-methyladenine glycosylase I n=1 Tax=Neptunomonas antarctica TaxID=619304 RepID=A0A1N7KCT7_9GAMM|nr:DNA-3-methyladenine glycosylase I [Neptunomonas antarctica]SIS59416.1 DNA-3-methyladenine glycosylase I [Neptunomonas antarctica]